MAFCTCRAEWATHRVRSVLTDDLRDPRWRGHPHPMKGHCYIAAEVIYHLSGGPDGPWVPATVKHEGVTHWFLRLKETGDILDPTFDQFHTRPQYDKGRGRGFLTREPSKRAKIVLERLGRTYA